MSKISSGNVVAVEPGEARFRLALAGSPTAVFHQDLELRMTWVSNPAIAPSFGFSAEEMVGKTDAELIGEENGRRLAPIKRAVIETGKQRREELTLNVRGREIHIDLTVAPVRDEGGEIVGIACTTTDITGRKRAEQALARRDAILDAIGRGAARLLADERIDDAIQAVLEGLGRAIGASRAYVFDNHRDADGRLRTSQRYEWAAPGVTAEIGNPKLQNLPGELAAGWLEALERGKPVQAPVRDLPHPHRAILEEQGILALAELPIHVAGELWGILGLDNCETERIWAPVELDGAKVAAQALGAAIERRRVHEQLSQSEARFRGMFENSSVGMVVAATGGDGRPITANRAFCEMLGHSEEELLGRSFREFIHPDDQPAQAEAQAKMVSGETDSYEAELRCITGAGQVIWINLSLSIVRTAAEAPDYLVGLIQDVTERRRSQERLAYLARHDELTGLPNRTMLREGLELALAHAREHDRAVAVLYVDLDRFKLVNDSLGHAAGDAALCEIATRLRQSQRPEDLVARHHGDEFLVLLADLEPQGGRGPGSAYPEVMPPSISAAVRRVHLALRQPLAIDEQEFTLDATIGISLFPADAEDAEGLLKHADMALYDGKRTGGGVSRVYTPADSGRSTELALRHRLGRALEAGELVLEYQPIVTLDPPWEAGQADALDLAARTPIIEALIRWEDPEQGLLSAAEFVPLAEGSGLVEQITDWVIGEASRQLRIWDEQGYDLAIAFNVSPRELRRPAAMRHILDRIAAAGAEPGRLVIELIESAATEDPAHTQMQFQEAREAGLRAAVDDFGAGYSSLSRLLEVRPDFVKIDRSFTAEIPGNERAAAVVDGFIQIALRLGITPVLEGIETAEQWRVGAEMGCTLGQGFYCCPPLLAAELTSRLGAGAND